MCWYKIMYTDDHDLTSQQPGSCQELLGGADLSPPAPSPKGAGRRGVPPPPSHPEVSMASNLS